MNQELCETGGQHTDTPALRSEATIPAVVSPVVSVVSPVFSPI